MAQRAGTPPAEAAVRLDQHRLEITRRPQGVVARDHGRRVHERNSLEQATVVVVADPRWIAISHQIRVSACLLEEPRDDVITAHTDATAGVRKRIRVTRIAGRMSQPQGVT